ncbi:MAG: folate family ECF transporter S component [Porcipelethomonas sp.]
MKRFFGLFVQSFKEIAGKNKITCIVVTGLLVAVSMAIEAFTIEIPFAKINFAFVAIAAIGMLYGPSVAFFAGGMCDILGYIVHPDGAFLPLYTLIGMFQGLIYGIVIYRKWGNISDENTNNGRKITEFTVRLIAARLLDVIIVNLCMNTWTNMHYEFIPEQAFYVAVSTRLVKNLLQLVADIPLIIVILPVILMVYSRTIEKKRVNMA